MPTYSYACTECGHAFDIRQSFTDDPLTDCPECANGAGRLRKVIHPVGIAFKGSGFYKTDSRAKAGAGSGGSGAKDAGAGGGTIPVELRPKQLDCDWVHQQGLGNDLRRSRLQKAVRAGD